MRKHLISILTLFIFISPLFPLFPQDLSISEKDFRENQSIVSEYFPLHDKKNTEALNEDNKLTIFLGKNEQPVLLPEIAEKIRIKKDIENSDFNTGIETIFLHYEKEFIKSIKEYFTILTDIKTLEGIEYYSQSKEKYRVLFKEAYPVSGKKRNNKIAVPEYDNNIKKYSFNSYIKDSTFGNNFYTLDYTISDNYLVMKMTNIDSMKLGFIPVIGKENLTFYLIIIADKDELAIYCSGICDSIGTGFLKKKIETSIHNRVIALYDWFIDNISE